MAAILYRSEERRVGSDWSSDVCSSDLIVTEAAVAKSFQEIFARASAGHLPQRWEDLPKAYLDTQEQLLRGYDMQIASTKLWPAYEAAIKAGEWPQYYIDRKSVV